jgi:hypothetical protein
VPCFSSDEGKVFVVAVLVSHFVEKNRKILDSSAKPASQCLKLLELPPSYLGEQDCAKSFREIHVNFDENDVNAVDPESREKVYASLQRKKKISVTIFCIKIASRHDFTQFPSNRFATHLSKEREKKRKKLTKSATQMKKSRHNQKKA